MILAHLSDLHLGFRAFERRDRGRNVREVDVARAFQVAIKKMRDIQPQVVLVAGDIFDRPEPTQGAMVALARGTLHTDPAILAPWRPSTPSRAWRRLPPGAGWSTCRIWTSMQS